MGHVASTGSAGRRTGRRLLDEGRKATAPNADQGPPPPSPGSSQPEEEGQTISARERGIRLLEGRSQSLPGGWRVLARAATLVLLKPAKQLRLDAIAGSGDDP